MNPIPDGFLDETRDAMSHFYDYAYLVNHPLLQRLRPLLGADSRMAVQKLRRLILALIEELRPSLDTPPADAAWRPYAVLHHRYVLGQELAEMERELGLGRRQIQREQRRALRALAIALLDRQQAAVGTQPAGTASNDALWQEISRVAVEQQVFEAGEQFERAMTSARALAAQQGTALIEQRTSVPLLISGDPALFRQLLLAALSHAIRLQSPRPLTVRLERQQAQVVCTLSAEIEGAIAHDLPEAITVLARAQGAHVTCDQAGNTWQLALSLLAAERERTVAIVEDNQDVVALFRRYLAGHGYRLAAIDDALHAAERIGEIRPDVVVLDVMMREIDGWEVLQQLKAEPRLSGIPVVVCSVLDEPQLATSLGADAYLRKPVRQAQLLECLTSLAG